MVHFCAALLVAAILSAPWPSLAGAGWAVTSCGASGLLYSGIVVRRARRQNEYQPVFEDWLWHMILPPLAYAAVLAAGLLLEGGPTGALFVIAAAVLLLVFIGIHNSWDTVTYVTIEQIRRDREAAEAEAAARAPVDYPTEGSSLDV